MHALVSRSPSDLRSDLQALGLAAQDSRTTPQRVLERLLDLSRCVALDAALQRHRATDQPVPDAQREMEQASLRLLEAKSLRRMGELRAELDRHFADAVRGKRSAPDAAALFEALVAQDLLAAPNPKRRSQLAQRLAERFAATASSALSVVLKELGWLQKEVLGALQQGTPRSQRLAALDEQLDPAFRVELEHARSQLERRLTDALRLGLEGAFAEIGPDSDVATCARWLEPRGCVGEVLSRSRKLSHTLLELEWSALMGLVHAALEPVQDQA